MSETLRLGRIAGIAIGVNWSVLVIFTLITVGLAAGRFPVLYPDFEPAAYAAAGLAAGVVFFLSLLAHELSHAIVARRNGMGVEGITLWLFGGVAKLTGEPPDAGADLRIAAVGPLVSVIAAAVFALVALGLDAVGTGELVVGVFVWLALINAILAAFNLIPAAPLDGGRVLRAVLWWKRGDRIGAAVSAARAGRTFGWILIALGFLQFVGGAGLAGLWLVLLGWFLNNAAAAEEQYAVVTGALSGVRAADVMTPDPTVAPASISVQQFVDDYVFPHRYSTFPLVDDVDRPVGLVTLGRVKAVPAEQRATTAVSQVACPLDEVAVASPNEPLAELMGRMAACPDGRSLVVEGDRVVGIVSPTDVLRALQVAELRTGTTTDLGRSLGSFGR